MADWITLSRSKAKGTAAETAIVRCLNENGIRSMRMPQQGAQDKGDIFIVDDKNIPVTIEVKNCKTMKLSEWVDEAVTERNNAKSFVGVVWHKRARKASPSDWYVTMTGEDFLRILAVIKS